jgi:hypothetical protein
MQNFGHTITQDQGTQEVDAFLFMFEEPGDAVRFALQVGV